MLRVSQVADDETNTHADDDALAVELLRIGVVGVGGLYIRQSDNPRSGHAYVGEGAELKVLDANGHGECLVGCESLSSRMKASTGGRPWIVSRFAGLTNLDAVSRPVLDAVSACCIPVNEAHEGSSPMGVELQEPA